MTRADYSTPGPTPRAPRAGFEPAAYSLGGSRSIRLSYRGRRREYGDSWVVSRMFEWPPAFHELHGGWLALSLKLRSRFTACGRRIWAGGRHLTPRPVFRGEIPPFENSVRGTVLVTVNGGPEIRFAGLAAVRITWITAIAVCGFAIVTGLVSGTDSHNSAGKLPGFAFSDGGDPSQQLPESASFDPVAAPVGVVDGKAQRTLTAASQGDRSQRAHGRAPGAETPSRARVPKGSGSQPENEGGRGTTSAPGPKAPEPPSSTEADTGSASEPAQAPAGELAEPAPEPPRHRPPRRCPPSRSPSHRPPSQ